MPGSSLRKKLFPWVRRSRLVACERGFEALADATIAAHARRLRQQAGMVAVPAPLVRRVIIILHLAGATTLTKELEALLPSEEKEPDNG